MGLLALAAGGTWALWAQSGTAPARLPTAHRITQPVQQDLGAPPPGPKCCTIPGPYNAGREEDVGPESAPVTVIGYQGNCWEHKIAGDMLVRLAHEYPDLLRIHLRPLESQEGRASGLPCTAYLLSARGYHAPGTAQTESGYDILVQKSPSKGGWQILQLEEAVRSALESCGGKASTERIAPTLPPEPGGTQDRTLSNRD